MAISDKPGKRKLQAAHEQGRQRGPGKPSPPPGRAHPAQSSWSWQHGVTMRFQRLKRALPGSRRVTKPRGARGAGPQGHAGSVGHAPHALAAGVGVSGPCCAAPVPADSEGGEGNTA